MNQSLGNWEDLHKDLATWGREGPALTTYSEEGTFYTYYFIKPPQITPWNKFYSPYSYGWGTEA